MPIEVEIGSFVCIKEQVIDKQITTALNKNQKNIAAKWESYRNFSFRVIGVDTDNLIILQDANNTQIHISSKHLELP